jgi:GNAT superfamily N-acetyltransferase
MKTMMTTPPAISVCQAVLADIDQLAPLFDMYRQFYEGASDVAAARAFLFERLEHGQSTLFIAQDGDEVLGFAQLYPTFSSLSMARAYVLNDLFVVEDGRRRGGGKALIAAATAYAKVVGACSMSLSTARTNRGAQALYQSCGWQLEETFIEYNVTLQD